MTTTEEMLRAIDSAHAFLFDLMNPQSTKRVPTEIRQRARRVVKHFPFSSDYMLQCLSSDQFASENICEELKDRCEHLETDRNNLAASTEAMQEKLLKVIEERDEARWEVCGFHHLTGFLAGDYANSRGWNYLNDERKWPGFPQSVSGFKLFLEGQDKIFLEINDRLRAERDEARREVCSMNETGLRMNESDKKREAKRRGWDCFNTPEAKLVRALNGVVVDGGKAAPTKYEDIADD